MQQKFKEVQFDRYSKIFSLENWELMDVLVENIPAIFYFTQLYNIINLDLKQNWNSPSFSVHTNSQNKAYSLQVLFLHFLNWSGFCCQVFNLWPIKVKTTNRRKKIKTKKKSICLFIKPCAPATALWAHVVILAIKTCRLVWRGLSPRVDDLLEQRGGPAGEESSSQRRNRRACIVNFSIQQLLDPRQLWPRATLYK